ncbi:hypothetical protein [Fibrobacter sp. UBA3718]|uniref:hypothetical protein n=1 Tax=Fibrobacter sp. UBA3718 TaxID=1946531 RepID=UPI0025B8DCCB|nr:hypothetical protein [Fibrobacter sp. UBA3718]
MYLSSPIRQAPANVWEWSNGTYSLLLNTDEELDFALDEDFAELLLDFAELLEAMLLLDFTELLLDFALELDFAKLLLDRSSTGAEDDERTLLLDAFVSLLLDRSSTGAEDDERTELLLASSQSSQTLDEESSPGRTKLLSSSQAAKRKRLAIKNVTPM